MSPLMFGILALGLSGNAFAATLDFPPDDQLNRCEQLRVKALRWVETYMDTEPVPPAISEITQEKLTECQSPQSNPQKLCEVIRSRWKDRKIIPIGTIENTSMRTGLYLNYVPQACMESLNR